MSDDSGTRKKRRASNEYQTPESISVEICDPVTVEEDGKPQYTTYKIITEVRAFLHVSPILGDVKITPLRAQ